MLVAHLSDTHLQFGPVGADAATGLHRALASVLTVNPLPNCVIISGDLADSGAPEEYEVLGELLASFPLPVYLVGGNHDNPVALIAAFGGTRFLNGGNSLTYSVELPEATLIVLDSDGRTEPAGRLGDEQIAWIDSVLAQREEMPAIVCLHHPPVPVGIPFLDAQMLDDRAALARVLAKRGNVIRVLAGHIHRTVTASIGTATVTIAPSTYQQTSLTLRMDDPIGRLDEPPGFLLHLIDGSTSVTHLVPSMSSSGRAD